MANVQLGSKAVGSIVKLKVAGVYEEFIVVHQGKPSSIYDESCDGTWLLMKGIYDSCAWNASGTNDYANSTIHAYLNSVFLKLLDKDIQTQIKQVKIPYRKGSGTSKTVSSGTNGLSCKIFLLSTIELCGQTSWGSMPSDGAKLDYFESGSDLSDSAVSKRVAYLNGSPSYWGLRTPWTGATDQTWIVFFSGGPNANFSRNVCGARPALVLPYSVPVFDDGSITMNTAPTTPPSLTLPEQISGGTAIPVSWGASTDQDGNLEGYVVERSVDGGDSWAQIYLGNATSTTNTVPFGTGTVMYRVRAYDSAGEYSPWRTSEQREVTNNTVPTAPAGITVPLTVLGGGEVTVTWSAAYDSEGNLSGYILERQVDGGEWAEIYRGTALSFTDAITKGWESVGYRVRAYDSYGAQSAYIEAPIRTVDNNTAPVITTDAGNDLGLVQDGFAVAYAVDDPDGDAVSVTETVDGETVRTFPAEPGLEYSFQLEGEAFQRVLNGSHTAAIVAGDGKVETVHALTFEKSVTACSITMLEAMEADAEITVMVMAVSGFIPMDANFQILVSNNANDSNPTWEDATDAVVGGANYVFQNHEAENGFAFNFRVTAERGPSGVGGYISSIQGGFQ